MKNIHTMNLQNIRKMAKRGRANSTSVLPIRGRGTHTEFDEVPDVFGWREAI